MRVGFFLVVSLCAGASAATEMAVLAWTDCGAAAGVLRNNATASPINTTATNTPTNQLFEDFVFIVRSYSVMLRGDRKNPTDSALLLGPPALRVLSCEVSLLRNISYSYYPRNATPQYRRVHSPKVHHAR